MRHSGKSPRETNPHTSPGEKTAGRPRAGGNELHSAARAEPGWGPAAGISAGQGTRVTRAGKGTGGARLGSLRSCVSTQRSGNQSVAHPRPKAARLSPAAPPPCCRNPAAPGADARRKPPLGTPRVPSRAPGWAGRGSGARLVPHGLGLSHCPAWELGIVPSAARDTIPPHPCTSPLRQEQLRLPVLSWAAFRGSGAREGGFCIHP